ncbi:adenylate/guanylate cyclase domain-containing protein [Leptospira sp. GIMC2001]|uniref:adenylate/guanylate cyclase domain-containing protein n=1 Tax=Leptospira sp. GIMC2001 TaxID=1513297 RepID=UPI002348F2E0|nr:adenylate/guanylate cyclase domain-containing protein [Leptospira sp. GIMC2001]WCL49686.1 adenylate/guanylate cyclase domain-containing protein [Leptospira sp. GIMC2001]
MVALNHELESKFLGATKILREYLPRSLWQIAEKSNYLGHTDVAGKEEDLCFMFCDMCEFTRFSEVHPASAVVMTINVFFEEASDIICNNGGDIDRFTGDGFLAIFTDPYEAARASAIMSNRFKELSHILSDSTGQKLKFRTGLHYGKALRGTIGGLLRKDYTVLGDAVNIASRIESNCKPSKVLVSTAFYQACSNRISTDEPFTIQVKGRNEAIEVRYLKKVLL